MAPHCYVAIAALAVACATGCVHTRSIPYETSPRAPKPDNFPIQILDSANLDQPYKVIGLIQANAGKLHSTAGTLEHLKAEARRMGADALIDFQEGPSSGRVAVPMGGGVYASGNTREVWSAKAIVWLGRGHE